MPESFSNQSPNQVPTPLRGHEVLALVGVVILVVGTFLPSIRIGRSSRDFLEVGNVVAVVVIGFAASAAWSVAMRRAFAVWPVGLALLLIVIADLLLVWNYGVRNPHDTLWGPLQFRLQYPAWTALLVGSVLIAAGSLRVRWLAKSMPQVEHGGDSRSAVGITLMLLGILYMIGLFLDGFRLDRVLKEFGIEPEHLRWPTLAASAAVAVTAFHVPHWNDVIARLILLATSAIFGALCIALIAENSGLTSAGILAWLSALAVLLLTDVGQRVSRTATFLVLFGPICVFVLYLAQGELFDLLIFTAPTGVLFALGWALQAKSDRYNLWISLGLIACTGVCVWLLVTGVPNEFVEAFGLRRPEEIVLVLYGLMLFGFGLYAVRGARTSQPRNALDHSSR